jgi:hypothetical protein
MGKNSTWAIIKTHLTVWFLPDLSNLDEHSPQDIWIYRSCGVYTFPCFHVTIPFNELFIASTVKRVFIQ